MSISWDSPSTVSKVDRQTPVLGSQNWAELAVQSFSAFASRAFAVAMGVRKFAGRDEINRTCMSRCGVCVLPCPDRVGRERWESDNCAMMRKTRPADGNLSRQRLSFTDLSKLAPVLFGTKLEFRSVRGGLIPVFFKDHEFFCREDTTLVCFRNREDNTCWGISPRSYM